MSRHIAISGFISPPNDPVTGLPSADDLEKAMAEMLGPFASSACHGKMLSDQNKEDAKQMGLLDSVFAKEFKDQSNDPR